MWYAKARKITRLECPRDTHDIMHRSEALARAEEESTRCRFAQLQLAGAAQREAGTYLHCGCVAADNQIGRSGMCIVLTHGMIWCRQMIRGTWPIRTAPTRLSRDSRLPSLAQMDPASASTALASRIDNVGLVHSIYQLSLHPEWRACRRSSGHIG